MYKISEINLNEKIPEAQKGARKYFELLKVVEGKMKGLIYECESIQEATKLRNNLYTCAKKYNNLSVLLRKHCVYVIPKNK